METESLRCIYCLESKPPDLFNREHVIHTSMTKRIQKNLVLHHRVCTTCNTRFGNTIDKNLSRSYWEGLYRFKQDMKPTSEANDLDQSKIKWFVDDLTAFKQDVGEFTEVLGDCLILFMADGKKEIFTLGQLKATSFEKLVDVDKIQYLRVFTERQDRADAIGALIKPHLNNQFALSENLEKHILTVTVTYDEVALRALAKIAFNYFAKVTENSQEIVFEASFDIIRKFIYRGIVPSIRPVQLERTMSDFKQGGMSLNGHWIRLYKNADLSTVIVRMSLFNRWVWKVVLSSNYAESSEIPTSSHVWDIDEEVCEQLEIDGNAFHFEPL